MSDLESVRKEITRLQTENAKLTTKIVRNRKLITQKEETFQLVQVIANEEEPNDSDSTQSSFKIKELPNGMDKVRELYRTVCWCGAAAKYNGFCEECVKKMKDDYEKALNEYMPISQQYEKVYSNNVNREVKMATIKAKIASMKQKLQGGDVSYMDADLKVMRDELDYLRKQIQVVQIDVLLSVIQYEVQQKEFQRFVEEKNRIQEDLELRLAKKNNKLKELSNLIEQLVIKNKRIEDNIQYAKEDLETYVK